MSGRIRCLCRRSVLTCPGGSGRLRGRAGTTATDARCLLLVSADGRTRPPANQAYGQPSKRRCSPFVYPNYTETCLSLRVPAPRPTLALPLRAAGHSPSRQSAYHDREDARPGNRLCGVGVGRRHTRASSFLAAQRGRSMRRLAISSRGAHCGARTRRHEPQVQRFETPTTACLFGRFVAPLAHVGVRNGCDPEPGHVARRTRTSLECVADGGRDGGIEAPRRTGCALPVRLCQVRHAWPSGSCHGASVGAPEQGATATALQPGNAVHDGEDRPAG